MRADDALDVEPATSPEPPSGAEGFVLEEVEMRGFMRYVERTDPPLRFPEKFTVITGRTGAGKSSILDAITFALYKASTRTDPPANATIDEICRPGGHVRVTFRQGDSRWDVRRGFTTKKEAYLEVTRDGDTVQGTIPEKEQTIRDVVGLDYVGFRNSTFVRQEEMKELGSARGADRLAVFQKLFRLEIFERALDRAREQHVALQGEIRAKEADIAARGESLQKLPAAQARLAGVRAELASRARTVGEGEELVARAATALKERQANHEAHVRAAASLEDRTNRLGALLRRLAEVRSHATDASALEAQRDVLAKDAEDLEAKREEFDALRERSETRHRLDLAAQSAVKLFEQAKKDHERRRDLTKDKIDGLYRKIASLPTDLNRDAAFDLLRDEGRFEERVTRIGQELAWLADRDALVRELALERARAEKALENIRSKVQSIEQDVFVLSEYETQIDDLKEELRREAEESHRTLKPLDDDKIGALRALDAAPFPDANRVRLQDLAREVQEKAARRKEADEIAGRLKTLGDPGILLRDLEVQERALQEERKAAGAEVARLEPEEAAFRTAEADLDRLRKALDEERKGLHVAEGEATQLARQIEDLEGEAGRLRESERQLDEVRVRLEVADLLVNRVFHKRGVVMYAVDQLLPELEIEASKNLAELTDGRFSRIKLETYEEGRGHGIRILVQAVDGLWHDVGEFSGGEKTQINAALRFAIAKELASLPQAGRTYGRMKTLFIDEGDLGSLDTEVSRELFVQKLFRMGEFFEKVILITHLAEVADKFPARIRVTMNPSQESRVDVLA